MAYLPFLSKGQPRGVRQDHAELCASSAVTQNDAPSESQLEQAVRMQYITRESSTHDDWDLQMLLALRSARSPPRDMLGLPRMRSRVADR